MKTLVAAARSMTMSTVFIRRHFSLLLALVFASAAGAVFATGAVPTVHTDTGALSGSHDAKSGLDEFKGIPYAAPRSAPCAGNRHNR